MYVLLSCRLSPSFSFLLNQVSFSSLIIKRGAFTPSLILFPHYHHPLTARVDLIFYLLAFPALIYVINMEYGHVATRLFAHYFLKEAAVLGV